jgi:hypothetical protein
MLLLEVLTSTDNHQCTWIIQNGRRYKVRIIYVNYLNKRSTPYFNPMAHIQPETDFDINYHITCHVM